MPHFRYKQEKTLFFNIIKLLLRFDKLLSPLMDFTPSYRMMCIAV